jgi:hypothetical protein
VQANEYGKDVEQNIQLIEAFKISKKEREYEKIVNDIFVMFFD